MATARLDPALRGQLVRFVLTGGAVTLLQVAIYWLLATPLGLDARVALVIGFAAAVLAGYWGHSAVSFRGHGARDAPTRRTLRFAVVSLVSLGLNLIWVWLFVTRMGGPTWWPIPLMVALTPLVTFTLNRQWVFK